MESIEKKFNQIGARVKVLHQGDPETLRRRPVEEIGINILNDTDGEYFDITVEKPDELELSILDTEKDDRHLLMMAKTPKRKMKFLCGYDERHFFSCAIPETAGVSTVFQAKEALKSKEILNVEKGKVKRKDLHKRHKKVKGTGKVHRQGEFFFIPMPDFVPSGNMVIHKKEPMRRGNSNKAHWAEFLIRFGGENVYVCSKHPEGISEKEHKKIIKENSEAKRWNWSTMTRDPKVYVNGKISHDDHKTLDLKHIWHKVTLNTENKAWAARRVTFLD